MATLEERVAALEAGYKSMFTGPNIDAILSRAREGGTIDIKISSMRQDAVGDVEAATDAAKAEVEEAAKAQVDAARTSASQAAQSATSAATSADAAQQAAETAAESVLSDYGVLKEQVQSHGGQLDDHAERLDALKTETDALEIQTVLGQGNLQGQIERVSAGLSTAERTLASTGETVRILQTTLTESGVTDLSAQSGDALTTESGQVLQGPALRTKTDRSLTLDGVPADAQVTGTGIIALSRAVNAHDTLLSAQTDRLDNQERGIYAQAGRLDTLGTSIDDVKAAALETVPAPMESENGATLYTENGSPLYGTAWTVRTDATLTLPHVPADAKATGTAVDRLRGSMTALADAADVRAGALSTRVASIERALPDLTGALSDLTGITDATLETEAGTVLQAQNGETLTAPIRVPRTDSALSRAHIPADAQATGEAIRETAAFAQTYTDGQFFDYRGRLTQRFGNVAVTTLPVLALWGDTSKMSKSVKVPLTYEWMGKAGSCTCKWQGSSSLNYPEKNYTISFDRDFRYNDRWPAYHKWCFKANFLDCTQARGIACARIWSVLVKTWADAYTNADLTDESGTTLVTESGSALQYPAYTHPIKYAPNYGATDGFPCVVEINGEFIGIYTCQIPKEEYMFGMAGKSGEAVVNASNYGFNIRLTQDNFASRLSVEYATDDMTDETIIESLNSIYDLLHGAADGVMDALAERMNITCAIDYMLFSALTCNWDGINRNWNLYTFDGGQHWNFSAYDLDNTCGNGWLYQYAFTMPGSWYTDTFSRDTTPLKSLTSNYLFNRIYTLNKPAIVTRYQTISRTTLSPNQVYYNHITLMKDIPHPLYLMDFKRWPTKPGTSIQTTGTIGTFLIMQAAALDREIAALQ